MVTADGLHASPSERKSNRVESGLCGPSRHEKVMGGGHLGGANCMADFATNLNVGWLAKRANQYNHYLLALIRL